jgi:WD40 repeat protein
MGRRLAFIGWRGLFFLDIGTEPQSTMSNSEIGQAGDLDWSPDASLIVVGCANGRLKLWDVAAERITMSFTENSAEITACAFSPDGTLVGATTITGTVLVWDIASTRKIAEFRSGARLSHLEWSADGNHLLVGGESAEEVYLLQLVNSETACRVLRLATVLGVLKVWHRRRLRAQDSGAD